jgi:hypothetical protein
VAIGYGSGIRRDISEMRLLGECLSVNRLNKSFMRRFNIRSQHNVESVDPALFLPSA